MGRESNATTERLAELVDEIEGIVTTAVNEPSLPDDSVRRLLQFISQVINVVEQAFHDALTLLVDIKYLTPNDVGSTRMVELRKQLDLLTSRSYYRDAAEICSRLKHLREKFDQFVRPSVSHLPGFGDWRGLFGLIEDREGRIIMLVEQSARDINEILRQAEQGAILDARGTAERYAEEVRVLLSELRDLNGRILGLSGKAGFLELTASNRSELRRELKLIVDRRDQSVTHGHRVTFGAGASIQNSNVVVADTATSNLTTMTKTERDEAIGRELENLRGAVEEMLTKLSPEKREQVRNDLKTLETEAKSSSPRRRWCELSIEGLIDVAKTCGAIAGPVIETAKRVASLLV